MARIMAIDYGTKRVGIAVTDSNQLIANGLTTVHARDFNAFLKEYLNSEEVACIVVGEPKRMNNEASKVEVHIAAFVKSLQKNFPLIPVERMDERFTSKLALRTMIEGGMKKKDRQNKETVDRISATIILQSYMEMKENQSKTLK